MASLVQFQARLKGCRRQNLHKHCKRKITPGGQRDNSFEDCNIWPNKLSVLSSTVDSVENDSLPQRRRDK